MTPKRSHKKKPAKDAPIKVIDGRQKAMVRHDFDTDELTRMGSDMSRELQRIEELEEQKKNATAEYTNKIKMSQAIVSGLANRVNAGYEMREQEVLAEFFAGRKMKRLYDPETKAFIREEPMSEEDHQIGLPFIKSGEVTNPSEPEEEDGQEV